jgi:dihydrolipoamide dehydrogenase
LTGADVTDAGVRCRVLDIAARTERPIHADALLLALGRRPATADLGLDTVGVVTDRSGRVQVDGFMETVSAGLYAVGDLAPTPQLRHLAAREGRIAALHAAGRGTRPVRHDAVLRALDTTPQIATVGLTASEARARGHLVAEGRQTSDARTGAEAQLVKVVLDAENERLLGLHAVGANAERLGTICTELLQRGAADAAAALPSADPLDALAHDALTEARRVSPAVRAHVAAELKRRPLRRLAEEAK